VSTAPRERGRRVGAAATKQPIGLLGLELVAESLAGSGKIKTLLLPFNGKCGSDCFARSREGEGGSTKLTTRAEPALGLGQPMARAALSAAAGRLASVFLADVTLSRVQARRSVVM